MRTGDCPQRVDGPADKFQDHYRRQLSLLVDGELAADQARFMLRRMEHDAELAACQERWQLLGDVLRGQACAPAPADFSSRVRRAVAECPRGHAEVPLSAAAARGRWQRWTGGAALAASVAAVALFMAREQVPDAPVPETVIATTARLASPVAVPAGGSSPAVDVEPALVAAVPAIAAAAARRPQGAQRRNAAPGQTAAGVGAARAEKPVRAIAATPVTPVTPVLAQPDADPFNRSAGLTHARPWPRSVTSPGLPQGAFNARFPAREPGGATFYPFEPRLPVDTGEAGARELLPRH